jgi:hypothetical protein
MAKTKTPKKTVSNKSDNKNAAKQQKDSAKSELSAAAKKKQSPIPSKVKGGKKSKEKPASDEVILESDEDFGAEEIPDLSEFDETVEVTEDASIEVLESESVVAKESGPEEVILTDAEGRRYCRVRDCDQIGVVEGYCRFHYLALWKKIQVRRKILADGKLERYVEELTSRYPDKFLEMIRKDLRNEKDFLAAIQELEIDEAALDNEFEDETQSFIDEVRGMTSESSISEEEEF